MTTSETAASRRARSRPRGSFRSRSTLRLPRMSEPERPPRRSPKSRLPRRSTLITSAPRSARMRVVTGPATTQVKSRTRLPSSGRTRGAPRGPRRCARRSAAAAAGARVARRGWRALAGRREPHLVPEARHVLERAGRRGLEAHVDVLAAAGRVTGEERAHHAHGREDARLVVGLEAERAKRRPVAMAVHEHHPAHRLRDRVRGAPGAVRPRLPERRDRGDDEPRARGAERRRATAEPGQRAGRLALDEHVGAGGQAAERRRARGRPPVERDAALAGAVEPEEEAPLRALDALPEGRDRAHRGAASRLDQGGGGAEAGEELPRKRALLIGEIE